MAETLSDDALITWNRLMADLKGGETYDAEDRDRGIRLINAVSSRINGMTMRKLASRTYTNQILDGTGGETLVLPQYPVTAISAIRVDSSREFGSSTILDSDDYDWDEDSGIVYIWGATPAAPRCVKITYTAGLTPVPDDLQQCVVEAVLSVWRKVMSKSVGVQSITGDGVTTQYEIDFPIPAMRVIDRYHREAV